MHSHDLNYFRVWTSEPLTFEEFRGRVQSHPFAASTAVTDNGLAVEVTTLIGRSVFCNGIKAAPIADVRMHRAWEKHLMLHVRRLTDRCFRTPQAPNQDSSPVRTSAMEQGRGVL